MHDDAETADKGSDDVPTEPLLTVDVSAKDARAAARYAEAHDMAIEDALAQLTAFDYPADDVWQVRPENQTENGP